MSSYFVTGAGTDVGKTFASCAMLHGARAAGCKVQAYKPVAAGVTRAAEADTAQLLEACGQEVTEEAAALISPWRFGPALAPGMAGPLDFDALVHWSRARVSGDGLTLFEGVGGAMVPLTDRYTVRDWISALGMKLIVVTGSYLGALHHTLSTLEALRVDRLPIAALIISESQDGVDLAGTERTLKHFARDIPLIVAQPRVSSWKEAAALHALGKKLA